MSSRTGTYSESRADDCSTAVTSAISHYRTYLKSVYRSSPISPENKWPPTPSKEYIHLAVVKGLTQNCRDQYIGSTLKGNIQEVLQERREISIEQILETECEDRGRVILVEGAPGIGKSTLTWELCRKWEEFSCVKKYSLVVLLRLREKEVQKITNASQLFYSCADPSLLEEVAKSQGSGILFILDGFDELPLRLQEESFLLELIQGRILPESKILVTSRPSATARLLTCCRPQIQKHIEILGFTEESVEAYARSVFSSEPEKLEKFKAYISASENPAINSLMYIPLNAAIIVEIYKGCDSDKFLPHTLTELYTQLSLTILNRHLKLEDRVGKFEDLPRSLYGHFLALSSLAYNGFVKEEVIFHKVSSGHDLVHFGFLDAVSALYGGGGVSYNFLHLTLQEFFAAYHISCLGSGGLDLFKQHGKDERWNIVWRFVAGLTKFKHLGPLDEGDVFINKRQFICRSNTLTKFFIECLFEAQTMKYWVFENTSFTELVKVYMSHLSGFDSYMLGYCIANYLHGVPLYVLLESSPVQPFLSGLKTASSCSGVIEELHISYCRDVNLAEFSALPLLHTMSLSFSCCRLVSTDLIILSQLIPHLHSLRMLGLTYNGEDGVLSVLQQLSHSKVTSLDLRGTDFSGDTPEQCYTALSNLISLLSGKLKELYFGRTQNCDRLISLVSAGPSSLNALYILEPESCISSLSSNTCITRLELDSPVRSEKRLSSVSHQVVEILKRNKTLLHLKLISFKFPGDIDALRVITDALSENNTLQCMEVWVLIVGESCRSHKFASKYMQKQQINPDAQITWKNCKYIVRIYPWP